MTPAKSNSKRRRGMHPMRDFDTLAADLARFDFSTRAGANVFYCHAAESWTCREIIFMQGMNRMTGDDPAAVALARATIDELHGAAITLLGKTYDMRYGIVDRKHGKKMGLVVFFGYDTSPVRHANLEKLLDMTINELKADKTKPRNQHPRKQRGADGQAVTKTEAANVLGITRPTLDKYLTNPTPPFGDPDKGINYLAAVMSNRANFYTFTSKPQIVAWIKHRNKAIDGETIHPERIEDIPDPHRQQPPAKPTNILRNRADK